MRVLFFFKNSESLAIEYLSAVLKQKGHQTDLLFDVQNDELGVKLLNLFSTLKPRIIAEKIQAFRPDLIAFSAFTNTFTWIAEICQFIKKQFSIPILIGGYHPTIAPEHVLSMPFVDYICIGEGERALLSLVDALDKKKVPSGIPGIWYKEGGAIVKNPLPPLIEDLDSLPFPDKDLFYKFGIFKSRYFMTTSRGCPNNCSYCINYQIHQMYPKQKLVRWRSVQNVIQELLWAERRYKVKTIHFSDENFLTNRDWLQAFAEEYHRQGLKFKFKILTSPNSISREKISILKGMGCKLIAMGVESGNEDIRSKILFRKMSNSVILNAARILHEAGISFDTFNIINLPYETPRNMLQTLVLNRKIRPNGFQMLNLYPFPNSEIARICKEAGILDAGGEKILQDGARIFLEKSLLNHPYGALGNRIRDYGFIYVKGPNFLRKLTFYLPENPVLKNLQLLFYTSASNLIIRLKETLQMAVKCRAYYAAGLHKQITPYKSDI